MRKAAAQMVGGCVAHKCPWLLAWVAYLFAAACCAASSGNPTIRLEGTEPSVEVILNVEGRAVLGLSGTVAYGIRLEQPSAPIPTRLNCNNAGPITLDQWRKATGACQILFQTEQPPGQAVQMVNLRISRQAWPDAPLSGGGSPELVAGRLVEVRVHPKAPLPPTVSGRPSVFAFVAGFFAAVVLGGIAFYLLRGVAFYLHKRRSGSLKPWTDPPSLLRLRLRRAKYPQTDPARVVEPPPPAILNGYEQLNGILARVANLEAELNGVLTRVAKLEAEREAAVRTRGKGFADVAKYVEALRDTLSSTAQAAEERSNKLARIIEDAQKLEPKSLSMLLTAIPGAALEGPESPGSATKLLDTFEEAVRKCAQETPSLRAEIDSLRAPLVAVEQAVDRLLEAAGPRNDSPGARLTSASDAIRQLREEMDALLRGLAINRVGLYFRLDLSTLPTTRQSLQEELADSLRRQVFRLEDPVGYFSMRYELTIAQALQEVVDCCDSTLDPSRRDKAVQDALMKFVAAAGTEWIDPQPGAAFVGVDHLVFGITPCSKPGEQPDHISALRVRGLRHRGQVLRKALVTIFV